MSMSRSGYSDDCENIGLWRGAVERAIKGKRGQALLRDLVDALDAMPDKRLYPGSFQTVDGEYCALGVVAEKRGIKTDDLGDEEDGCDTHQVGDRFGIAAAMAAEIMYLNDEYAANCWKFVDVEICGPMPPHHFQPYGYKTHQRSVRVHNDQHPQQRWAAIRRWAIENLKGAQDVNKG